MFWITLFIHCFSCDHCLFSGYVFHPEENCQNLNEEEFRAGYRKAQLIDVREPNEFDDGHILGARNIPLTQIKMRHERNSPGQAGLPILPKRNAQRTCGTNPAPKRL